MNALMTKERLIREVKPSKAVWHFRGAQAAASARQPIVAAPVDNFDNHMLRVLIVDDHHANTDTLSMLVDRWGHDVRRAYDGATGLALAAAFRPDVLLLDMLMPEVTGFEVAMQVRRQGRLKQCFYHRAHGAHRCAASAAVL
jgi:PleD family two-component response regulator